MSEKAIQDFYPENTSYCYGCGRLNEVGLHIRSFIEGDEIVCRYEPKPYHIAIPGYVYGGLLASLIDCHSTGSASAAVYRSEGRALDSEPPVRFLTASLRVDYLKPTPLGKPLELRSRIREHKGRKVVVATELSVEGIVCVRGEVVAVQAPDSLVAD
jgi:acyl-coenzyme A thioesterase PaaI-like protein